MHQQAYRNDPGAPVKKQEHIDPAGDIGMQGMKTDAAPAGNEDGCGEQVIKIDQHGEQENEVCSLPFRPEEIPGNDGRKYEVKEIMYEELERFHARSKIPYGRINQGL